MTHELAEDEDEVDEGREINWTLLIVGFIGALLAWGVVRVAVVDTRDPYKCHALLNEGRWLDSKYSNWQPPSCMLHNYVPADTSSCLSQRTVVLVGDSTVRQLYFALVKTVDPTYNATGEKHSDRSATAKGVRWEFIWDPYLNGTRTQALLAGEYRNGLDDVRVPAMAVIGGGLWHLRHLTAEMAMAQWVHAVDRVTAAAAGELPVADEVVLLPVERPIDAQMSTERRTVLRQEDIDAMNAALDKRMAQYTNEQLKSLSVPYVYNVLTQGADSETDDGLHFSNAITTVEANILLNMRCNSALPRKFPLRRTCCFEYPYPNPWQAGLIFALIAFPLLGLRLHNQQSSAAASLPSAPVLTALGTFGAAIALIYLADRTPLFPKSQKQFEPAHLIVLCVSLLAAGLVTMTPPEKDLGFLNREQTDEWKGWMQIAILIYHYLGASKVSRIYNPIRVLVAAYIFMSGYGHFFFYYKKADYSFARVVAVLVRLNLLPVVLSYAMDTDWLSYYFSPLITMWYLVIYAVMWIGHKWNANLYFMLSKLAVSVLLIAAFFHLGWPLESFFTFTNSIFGTEWNAREWSFRVTLDLYIPFIGMLAALATIKAGELRLAEQATWPRTRMIGFVASGVSLLGWFLYEHWRDKYAYNRIHAYLSPLPVVAFALLRNATPLLRSTHSRFFAYIGRCSLETFIVQFHLWLAGDTYGLLAFIPGNSKLARMLNFLVATAVFLFVSVQIARTTGELTDWICGKGAPAAAGAGAKKSVPNGSTTAEYVPLAPLDGGAPPARMARLGADLRVRFGAIMLALWVLNLVYPSEVPPSGHLLPTH